jgi:hypothetical protein
MNSRGMGSPIWSEGQIGAAWLPRNRGSVGSRREGLTLVVDRRQPFGWPMTRNNARIVAEYLREAGCQEHAIRAATAQAGATPLVMRIFARPDKTSCAA